MVVFVLNVACKIFLFSTSVSETVQISISSPLQPSNFSIPSGGIRIYRYILPALSTSYMKTEISPCSLGNFIIKAVECEA